MAALMVGAMSGMRGHDRGNQMTEIRRGRADLPTKLSSPPCAA